MTLDAAKYTPVVVSYGHGPAGLQVALVTYDLAGHRRAWLAGVELGTPPHVVADSLARMVPAASNVKAQLLAGGPAKAHVLVAEAPSWHTSVSVHASVEGLEVARDALADEVCNDDCGRDDSDLSGHLAEEHGWTVQSFDEEVQG